MPESRYENDKDVSQRLAIIRARDAQLWGRKLASAEVTPGMLRHIEGADSRCICDACDSTRPQPKLAAAPLRAKTIVNKRTLRASVADSDEFEPRVLKLPKRPLNLPRKAPSLNERQIALLNKWRM